MTKTLVKSYLISAILVLALIAELWGLSMSRGGSEVSIITSLIYLSAGLVLAVLPLWKFGFVKIEVHRFEKNLGWLIPFLKLGLLLFLSIQLFQYGGRIFNQIPIDYTAADMLPVIQKMGERFLAGEEVYQKIPEIWGGMLPVYLPAMWLPFVPAEIFSIDPRWMSLVFIITVLFLILFVFRKLPLSLLVIISILIVSLSQILMFHDRRLIVYSEEGIVLLYYGLLAFGLIRKNPSNIGIAIACCALSRYGFVTWLPFYFFWLWYTQQAQMLVRVIVSACITSILILSLTGTWDQLLYFINLQSNYLEAIQDPAGTWKYELLINESLGLAKFFSFDSLSILHYLMIPVLVLAMVLFGGFVSKFQNKITKNIVPILALKLSLVLFYNMLTMPYAYLFYSSTIVSFLVLIAYWKENLQLKEN